MQNRREKGTVFVTLVLAVAIASVFYSSLVVFPYPHIIDVACVGDSITEGTYYPLYLQDKLGDAYNVQNFGAGGSTAMLQTNKPYLERPEYLRAKAFRADIVIIMLGTNDAIPWYNAQMNHFIDDYKKIISTLGTEHTKFWLVRPPPIYNDSLGPNSAILVEQVIPRIEQVANELDLPIIDVYSALLNHPDYFLEDGVHPNAAGAMEIANTVYQALTR